MSFTLEALLDLLDLEAIEEDLFRGQNRDIGTRNVFGGQVLAQALVAAGRTVEPGRVAHSAHAYFILPGDVKAPIVYMVDRSRDGRSFTTRRVVAVQHGRPIFNLALSFQVEEEGIEHQDEMPEVPGPEELPSELELARRFAERIPEAVRDLYTQERPIEMRPIDPVNPYRPEKRPPRKYVWLRAAGPLPDDVLAHQGVLAYASDFGLLGTALLPHALSYYLPQVQAATLDHALWFHRPFRADDWLLYAMDSPAAAGARGFTRGSIYTRDGRLVASVAQEGLLRLRE